MNLNINVLWAGVNIHALLWTWAIFSMVMMITNVGICYLLLVHVIRHWRDDDD